MKVPSQFRRGAGRQTVAFPKSQSHIVVKVTFPTKATDSDHSKSEVDAPPPTEDLCGRFQSLTLIGEGDVSQERETSEDGCSDSKGSVATAPLPLTNLPVRQRTRSTRHRRRDFSLERSPSRNPEREKSATGLNSMAPTPPPVPQTQPVKQDKRSAWPRYKEPWDSMPRSPLSKSDDGCYGFVWAAYHCKVKGCGFAASSEKHVRDHMERTSHRKLVHYHMSGPVAIASLTDETITF